LGIYAALGVPEVWICDGESIQVYALEGDAHVRVDRSIAFPFLPIDGLERFLAQRDTTDETSLLLSFLEWIRALPR
jgi:hypothetical protein